MKTRILMRQLFSVKVLGTLGKEKWDKIPVETCRNLGKKYEKVSHLVTVNKGFAFD